MGITTKHIHLPGKERMKRLSGVPITSKMEESLSFVLNYNGNNAGDSFFRSLAAFLSRILEMDYVSIQKWKDHGLTAETLAVFSLENDETGLGDRLAEPDAQRLITGNGFCFPNGARHLFPNDRLLQQLNAESYAGTTLWGSADKPVGFIVAIGRNPLADSKEPELILKQVSLRAAAEIEISQLKENMVRSRKDLESMDEKMQELEMINEQQLLDIKQAQQQERFLKEEVQKYRTIADFAYNFETWLNPEGTYNYISPSCQRITGYTADEFTRDAALLVRITLLEDRPLLEAQLSKMMKGPVIPGAFEFRIHTLDGHERWIGHHCQPVYDRLGNFSGQRSTYRDITHQKITEKVLLDSQKQLRLLSQRMDEITEAERTRIAREIHDELGHLLTALKYDLDGLLQLDDLSTIDMKAELSIMIDMVDSLIDSVRKIATELRPGILDQLGLFAAIEWLIKQFRLRTKICCTLSIQEMDMIFDKNETNITFRIIQEILTNILRHSEATHVRVNLARVNDGFLMEVADNGIGFEYDDHLQVNTLGLVGMKERALSIGGAIHITSKPGKGTTVRFTIPGK